MEKTYLVQRLTKPKGRINPFAFGGGLVKGGLSDEGANLISKIWDFDYMGASEFEWGAIPKTIQRIAQYSSKGSAVIGNVQLEKDIHYFCERDMKIYVEQTIRDIANNKLRLKEPAYLKEAIKMDDGFGLRYKGWLELNNGFAFFVDEEMYGNTLRLFGVKE
ncbi:MAG TPA: hypothetical protein VJ208_01950 [Candidatus Nanoarchaeia archaeon]|nr:hypothetical protein [Candidatus Nanoarchaeia archaeon]